MTFESIHYNLVTLNPRFLSLFVDFKGCSLVDQGVEESSILLTFFAFIGIVVLWVLFYMLFSTIKVIAFHYIFGVPQFSLIYRFTPKISRLAYKVIGCHIVVADGGDRRGQYVFLISYLKRRFPKEGSMDLKAIPKLHQVYKDTHKVFKLLNKHLDEEHKLQFIDFMVDLAFFNEKLSRREVRLIYEAGEMFGIPQNEVKSILSMRYKFYQDKQRREQEQRRKSRVTRRPSVNLKKQALQILGLSPTVKDFNEVKKAYRNMAKKHHPDRFHNDSEQEREKAHERFTAINTAYEYLEQILK